MPVNTKGGVKRSREGEGATPGAAPGPSQKRVKSAWDGLPNEEARKSDEQAEQALAFLETLTKLINENPQFAEAASNALDKILHTYPSAPAAAMASSLNFRDLPPTSPSPLGNDGFEEFVDFSAFNNTL
jgi:hypothetical protein